MIGMAVLGAGSAARQHLQACQASECRPVYVNDLDDARARALAGETGLPQASLVTILASDAVQIVAVCTPPATHHALASACLAAGKAVLLEKPATVTCAELDDLVARAEAASRPLFVMHQHRFALPLAARSAAWSRAAIGSVEVHRPRASEYFQTGWRSLKETAGGGIYAHLGVHYVDLACQLLGRPVAVHGAAFAEVAGADVDTRLCAAIEFAGGAVLALTVARNPGLRRERLCLSDAEQWLTVDDGAVEWHAQSAEPRVHDKVPTASLRGQVYADLVRACRNERTSETAQAASAWGSVFVLERVAELLARRQSAASARSDRCPGVLS